MRGLLLSQWLGPIASWGHRAEAHRQGRNAQSAQAARPGGFSSKPVNPSWRMGYLGKSPRGGGESAFQNTTARTVARVSKSAARENRPGGRMRTITLALLRFYQACISPTLPSSCRFFPSCSEYACEAVAMWGARRGLRLTIRRLLRCRPLGKCGYDPVPSPGRTSAV
jgi:uncharacterized protein